MQTHKFTRGSDKLKLVLKAEWIALEDKSCRTCILPSCSQCGRMQSALLVTIWHFKQVKKIHCKGNLPGSLMQCDWMQSNLLMSCSCHQHSQVASMKGCSHWLSWNHSWRSQMYSGALSASHHPMRKKSLQISYSVTVLAELNTQPPAGAIEEEVGWPRLTLQCSCRTSIRSYQEQISVRYLQI